MAGLHIENLWKSFGGTPALGGISLHVQPGEVLAVLGPSGCGKSTLLSIIAGLTAPDQGKLSWNDTDLSIPTHRRNFGLMFQDYALFPHKNVFENVAFGLRMARQAAGEIETRVTESLALVGLPNFAQRDVNNLSGGEQQRVALARALAPQPQLLMLDEPLGSLDRALRARLLDDLKTILRQTGQTTIYVTHDQEEAFALADRVVVMQAGQIMQTGTPAAIYRQPNSAFVANFIGLTNILPGTAAGEKVITVLGNFPITGHYSGEVAVLVRPEAAQLAEDGDLAGKVLQSTFRGRQTELLIEVNGINLTFEFNAHTQLPSTGDTISFQLASQGIQIFSEET